jgi:coenzyme F420 hydrogenase subunit beta
MAQEMKVGFRHIEKKLREKITFSFTQLKKDIIDTGVCTQCGACVAFCDNISMENGVPILVGTCESCGVCYAQCPRTIITEEGLVGNYITAYTAKSKFKTIKGQDGGVVTALLSYCMKENLIDAAVVTQKDPEYPWKPYPTYVTKMPEVRKASGSIYCHSHTIPALVSAIEEGYRSIGFVGTPCNIDAVYKMQKSPSRLFNLMIKVNILRFGLFCMDSFTYDGMKTFIESKNIDLSKVRKMEIIGGFLRVHYDNSMTRFRIRALDEYRSSSCHFCTDLTSENSDISFGGVGSPPGYTTILTRSNIGDEIVREAEDDGWISLDEMGFDDFTKVLNLARIKKIHLYTVARRRD